ncbi:YtxH domain-containing protein [Candidatus Saccharibacteria bacterium]|nr:YtxH domain-containing protein [Candidatus Saccharibacteria bacterium]MCB0370886.1 YtxH domain-containing protein [Bdellovibrionales bacterium]
MSSNNGSKFAVGAMLGVVVGLVAGILTAPKSGKETRKDLKDTATKVFAEAEKRLKVLYSELDVLITKGKSKASDLSGRSKEELDKALDVAQKAQVKAKEVISAVRGGETTNPELEKAIKEVTSAKNQLKKYLQSS